jgi:hypothetical protein
MMEGQDKGISLTVGTALWVYAHAWLASQILGHKPARHISSFFLPFVFVRQFLLFVFVIIRYSFLRPALQALGVSFNSLDAPGKMADIVFLTAFTANFSRHGFTPVPD